MDFQKLAPWNWFKKEEEEHANAPFTPKEGSHLKDLQKDFDKMFESMKRNLGFSKNADIASGFFKPLLDITSDDNHYTIKVELPGVEQKDIELELEDDILRIKGEKKQEVEEKSKGFYKMERSYGSFQRILNLPEDADKESINSSYGDGILKVQIAKTKQPKSDVKKIKISS